MCTGLLLFLLIVRGSQKCGRSYSLLLLFFQLQVLVHSFELIFVGLMYDSSCLLFPQLFRKLLLKLFLKDAILAFLLKKLLLNLLCLFNALLLLELADLYLGFCIIQLIELFLLLRFARVVE